VPQREELLELYTTFEHNRIPVVSRTARWAQHARWVGAEVATPEHGAFADVLSLAWRGKTRGIDSTGRKYEDFDIRQALATFEPELRLLDSIGPTPEVFYTGVCAAALLALAVDANSIEFFKDLADPVISLREHLLTLPCKPCAMRSSC